MLASRQSPVVYVVFDLLFHGGRSLMGQPLCKRREILADTPTRETGIAGTEIGRNADLRLSPLIDKIVAA